MKKSSVTQKKTAAKTAKMQQSLVVSHDGKLQKKPNKTSDKTILDKLFSIKVLKAVASKGFRFLDGVNRSVIPSHVTKMATSVSKIGITRPVVVAYFEYKGVKDYYVIDGQNLYHALLRLGLDIPYRVITVDNEQDMVEKIALLNTSSKTWTLLDYVTAWSYIKDDYKKLNHYFNVYDLEMATIASILHGYSGSSNANITKVIKEGSFNIGNLEKAVNILDFTTDVLNIVPRLDRNANRTFVSAYTGFVSNNYDSYNHSKFCTYLKKNAQKLEFVNADKQMIVDFFSRGF
jgi:hypothetical protein